MAKYRETKSLNLPDIDSEILAFWEDIKYSKNQYRKDLKTTASYFMKAHRLRMENRAFIT